MTISPTPELRACLVSRDLVDFALLIEDLDAALEDTWGELNFTEAAIFLRQSDARDLDYLIVAVDEDDRDILHSIQSILGQASFLGLPCLLVAEGMTASELNMLMQSGTTKYVPYPLVDGALELALKQVAKAPKTANTNIPTYERVETPGALYAFQGLAGGTGSTTLAVNLASEMAALNSGSVCLVDLDLQFGNVAGLLAIPAKDTMLDLISDVELITQTQLNTTLYAVEDNFQVLVSPNQIAPFDLLESDSVTKLLHLLRAKFDHVIIDMPKILQSWSDVVIAQADTVFCPIKLDVRNANAAIRFCNTLRDEELGSENVEFVINYAPDASDVIGHDRIAKLGRILGGDITICIPDGGDIVTHAADRGMALAKAAAQSPIHTEITKLAVSLQKSQRSAVKAA